MSAATLQPRDWDLALAIETSNPSSLAPAGLGASVLGVTLARWQSAAGGWLELRTEPIASPNPQHDDLAACIERCAAAASVVPRDLRIVAVSAGPGGFTSVRIAIVAAKSPDLWPSIIGGAFLALALILWLALRSKGKTERPLRARDVFAMPKEVDGFAVVALLRRLCSSPLVKLKETQQSELQTDLKRVEAACFGASAGAMSETDLRAIASKWLRSAT